MKKFGIFSGSLLAFLLVAILALVHFFGPVYGTQLVGKPLFLTKPSPERYVSTVLTIADRQALYANSEEYAQERSTAMAAAATADSYEDIYQPLHQALRAAGGKHSALIEPSEVTIQLESSPQQYPSVTKDGAVAIATVPAFDHFTGDSQKYSNSLAYGIDEAVENGACGVVIDLRGNTGGDMHPMLAGLAGLLPNGTALEFVTANYSTPVTIEGNSVTNGGHTAGVDNAKKHKVPVALLTDTRTASSGEATLLAFRGVDSTRTFGTPTTGFASANITFEMPDGARVMITTSHDRARTGETFGDNPIEPDIVTADPVGAAKGWITSQQSCR